MDERVSPNGTASQLYSDISQTQKETSSPSPETPIPCLISEDAPKWRWWCLSFRDWICLPKLSAQQRTPFTYLFAHVFQLFSSTYIKLHPLKCFSGAKPLLTPILLSGQEELKINQPLLPSSLTLAGRTLPLHGVCPLCAPPPPPEAVLPMVATGQRDSVTCAIEVILCKSTSEFRPVSINLLS